VTKSQTLSLIAFSAILALVGFQNCSKVGVQDMASAANEKGLSNGQGAELPPLDVFPSDVAAGEQPPVVSMPEDQGKSPESPVVSVPEDHGKSPEPPVASVPEDHSKSPEPPVASQPEDHSKSPEPPVASVPEDQGKSPEPPVASVPGDQSGPQKGPENDDDNMSDSELVAFCLNGESKVESLKVFEKLAPLSGPTVTDQNGPTAIISDKLDTVADIHGPLLIKGKTAAANAKSVSDLHGRLVICGMVIDELKDTHGHMILVNSTIKSMVDHDGGSIRSINSEIQESSDSSQAAPKSPGKKKK
jgi:hypothetical protein